jgi:hypothetical protein
MYEQATALTETPAEPSPPVDEPVDDLAVLKARCAMLKLEVGKLKHQLAGLLAWPAFRDYCREAEAARALAEAARREAERRGWMAARVGALLKDGYLLGSGELTGDGEKWTARGDVIRFGHNSTGYYEYEDPPADDGERQRRRVRYWQTVRDRAERSVEYGKIYNNEIRHANGLQLELPPLPGPRPTNMEGMKHPEILALCNAALAEIPEYAEYEAAAEERRRHGEAAHRAQQLYG